MTNGCVLLTSSPWKTSSSFFPISKTAFWSFHASAWKVLVHDAHSTRHTPNIAFRHRPPKEGCRKPVLGVWAPGSRCLEFSAPEYPRRICPLLILKVWNGRFRIKGKTAKNNTRPPIHQELKGKHLRKTHTHPFITIPWLLFVCFVFSFDCTTATLALSWMIFACAGVFLWIIIYSVHRCSGYTDFKGDGHKLRCSLPRLLAVSVSGRKGRLLKHQAHLKHFTLKTRRLSKNKNKIKINRRMWL